MIMRVTRVPLPPEKTPPEKTPPALHAVSESEGVPAWLPALIHDAHETDGQPPFSDQTLIDLRQGKKRLLAIGEMAAAAVPTQSTGTPEIELVVSPQSRRGGLGGMLLDNLIDIYPRGFRIWAHGDHPGARALASSRGLSPVRTLLQLRATLDERTEHSEHLGHPGALPSGITLNTFVPGEDEGPWLALNARAFAGHPEQSRLSATDLAELMGERWFDAETFLIARDHTATMIGFVWVKVDELSNTIEPVGEIYVLGVDPDSQSAGLGHALLDAGLDLMRARSLSIAHLYVEGDNTAALRLYRKAHFTEHTVDVQYEHTQEGGSIG
jgi:mycothiol synthase